MAIANIETILTPEEQEQIPPSIFGKYFVKGRQEGREEGRQEGRQEGREEGILLTIHNYIKKNPAATDHLLADLFEVSLEVVHNARHFAVSGK